MVDLDGDTSLQCRAGREHEEIYDNCCTAPATAIDASMPVLSHPTRVARAAPHHAWEAPPCGLVLVSMSALVPRPAGPTSSSTAAGVARPLRGGARPLRGGARPRVGVGNKAS